MAKDVVLTGLRSNAEFHIGNYLGAILPMVDFQNKHAGKYQLNMFIPDLHSFTTPIDHSQLYRQTHQNLKVFVAAGLDIAHPDTFIYRQSYIPAHSEMTWILDCFTGFGELTRMNDFRDKAYKNIVKLKHKITGEEIERRHMTEGEKEEQLKKVSVGLFNYPVLMAADILLYGAKYVPVGDDQRQHVEFTRDIALRMNNQFGDLFVVPADNKEQMKFAGRSEPVRIRSLRSPEKKMSKSIEDPAGTINLSDKPEEAAKKIMSATTDSVGSINYDFAKQPGVSNLIQILALLTDKPVEVVAKEYQGQTSYGPLKEATADAVKHLLTDLQSAIARIDDKSILAKLETDEAAMTKIANSTLAKVQKAVGLRP